MTPTLAQSVEELLLDEASVAKDGFKYREQRLSCREYYAYKLEIRSGNYLIRASRLFQQYVVDRLFQQYVVDMYAKIENTRLDFVHHNQTLLRTEQYQGIMDSMYRGKVLGASKALLKSHVPCSEVWKA